MNTQVRSVTPELPDRLRRNIGRDQGCRSETLTTSRPRPTIGPSPSMRAHPWTENRCQRC